MVDVRKIEMQFRLQSNGILSVFDMYGQNVFFNEVAVAFLELARLYHRRMNGEDVPITTTYRRIK